MKYKGILFDLDGVLIDSKDVHYNAFSEALHSRTGITLSRSTHTERFCGLPTIEKLKILQNELQLTNVQVEDIFDLKQKLTKQLIEEHDFFRNDVFELIKSLSQAGVKIAICSNTTRPTFDKILESLKIKKFLNLTLSSNDVQTPKPSPEIFIKAMRDLQLSPEETLILEDSIPGIEAAKATGADYLEIESSASVCEALRSHLGKQI